MSANEFGNPAVITAVANEAITIYRFVNLAGTVAVEALKVSIADTTEVVFGIAVETVASGAEVGVAIAGVGRLEVDGSGTAIVAGDTLAPDGGSLGKGIKTVANLIQYGAIAMEPSVADGDIIRVALLPGVARSNA